MTREELKIRLDEIAGQIADVEIFAENAYAELGRELYPLLADGECTELAEKIRKTEARLNALKEEQIDVGREYKRLTEASTCFFCKTTNADGAVFCEECGKRLGEKPKEYCDSCGTMNRPGQKFCGECGKRLPE